MSTEKHNIRVSFREVLRDFLSCFPLSRNLYGEPTDDLTCYASAVALHGVDSEQAQELLHKNAGNEYFLARASVLAKCKELINRPDVYGHERPSTGNPVTAGEYAQLLFAQSDDIALLLDPRSTQSLESDKIGNLLNIANATCPSLDQIALFLRNSDVEVARQQCAPLAKVIPRRMAIRVFCTHESAWGNIESPSVLTDQGGFDFIGQRFACDTFDYRLVAPDRHVGMWQDLQERSPEKGFIAGFDIQGEMQTSVNMPESALDF